MPKKRYRPEEITGKLREADVLISLTYQPESLGLRPNPQNPD
ncbi:MAG: hypothetical protein PHP88_01225 [bacterium]|nr:hypothetical protein [bacterium]